MKTTILKQSLILLSSATLLAACGGDGGDSPVDDGGANPGESGAQALLYAYPDNGQGEVPTQAPIALRFTSNVAPGNVKQNVTLCCDDAGENLDFDVERVDDEPRGVLLTPTDELAPGTQYTIAINDLRLSKGTAKDQTLTFTTRTLQEGPKSAVVQEVPAGEDEFQLSRTIPNGSELEPVMDFSAFRFQFTQPIDRATATYGDGNTVVLKDSEGTEVDAGLLVDGAYMTVDPTADYLTPGETYTLTLGGLQSTYGETFAGQTIEFTPEDSSPRGKPGFLVQRITQNGTSRLTGEAINQVPVNGTLLGENANVTQAQSEYVIAELADVTQYTDVTPIRLPKGTLLEGTPIEMVKIGGNVPAGFGSGDVTMRVLSDATGYLVPNPYTDKNPDRLRIVHLFMDVGIATENPKANGGFTQNLLHIHLVGVAEVDPNGGVLNIDATGMVEPDILGQEYGYGLLSFQLQSYKDQTDALLADARAALEDTTPPTLQSWTADQKSPEMPTDESGDALSWLQQPGTPITLNFDEPLDPASLKQPGALTVTQDGATLDINYKVDGAAVVIQPETGLQYLPAGSNPEYAIQLGSQITDLAGNSFVPETLTFKLPGQVKTRNVPDTNGVYSTEDVQVNSPALLSTYPGYPCVTDPGTRDLKNGLVGRCAGGLKEGWTSQYELSNHLPDDNLPLMALPANQPIILQFSKAISPDSVQLGGSFNVTRVNSAGQPVDVDGNVVSEPQMIQGQLIVEGRKVTFLPDKPWTAGQIYRYTLGSNKDTDQAIGQSAGYIGSAEALCDGSQSICSMDSPPLPLRTQPLGMVHRVAIPPINPLGGRVVADHYLEREYFIVNGGGPNLDIFFEGARATENVLQTLRTTPDSDPNGNLIHEVNSITDKLEDGAGNTGYYSNAIDLNSYDDDGFRVAARYSHKEPLPSGQPDPNADSSYDPGGVLGLPNSAKILSLNVMGSVDESEEPWMLQGTDSPSMVGAVAIFGVDGGNIGCGYESVFDPATGEIIDQPTTPSLNIVGSNPVSCPKRKFTYIKMGLNATVTNEYVTGKGIRVLIWPSQALATSIMTYARNPAGGFPTIATPSGDQIMRMRYAKDDPECIDTASDPCPRTKPITGWIYQGENDHPTLTADVDLYVDLPLLARKLQGLNVRHNISSYPISMTLSGPVSFLEDGRMLIEQRNLNPVDLDLKTFSNQLGGIAAGRIPLRIPVEGTFLQMVSAPIKSLRRK